jgi:hypothetical protein
MRQKLAPAALKIERLVKYGEWAYGKPLLNPLGLTSKRD